MNRPALAASTLLAGLTLAPLAGCAIVRSEHHTTYSGNYVPSDSLSRIEIGEATPEYTEAILGAPTNKSDLEDGSTLWRWDHTIRKSGGGSVFLVFNGRNSSEKRQSTFVEFRDGVACKKWRT